MHVLFILCQRRDLHHLVDVLGDWQGEGDILLYGYTNKMQDGFILMQWNTPITEDFQQKQLKDDPGIIDFLVYDAPQHATPTTA